MHFPTIALATLISTFNFVHAVPKCRKKYAFVLTGDSTTAANGGWGDGFCSILAVNTSCANHGKSGATTGTFEESGALDSALADVALFAKAGKKTFVTVQFGHNDQKIVSTSQGQVQQLHLTHFTLSQAPPESMGRNLTTIAGQIRAAGGEPVLVTSLSRRNFFSNGTINDILGPWANGNCAPGLQISVKSHILIVSVRNHPNFEREENSSARPSCYLDEVCSSSGTGRFTSTKPEPLRQYP
jgi:hypothetical protein